LNLDLLQEVRADVVDQAPVGAVVQVPDAVHGQVVLVGAVPVNRLVGRRQAGQHAELVGIGHHRAGTSVSSSA